MLFNVIIILCICLGVLSLIAAVFYKRLRVFYIFFACLFFFYAVILFLKVDKNLLVKEDVTPKDDGVYVGTSMLSYYVQDGAKQSETYYVEATNHDTYKFCYFHEDGEHIVKKEVSKDKVELVCQENDLPYRVVVYIEGGKPTLWQLHLPDDANTIQLDTDGK